MTNLSKNEQVVCTELEDGAVLLNMQNGFYYSLNETALEIWRRIEPGSESGELARVLFSLFDAGEHDCLSLTQEFVSTLKAEELVKEAGPGDPPANEPLAAPQVDPSEKKRFLPPQLVKHDEPLHEISTTTFDAQLPLAE